MPNRTARPVSDAGPRAADVVDWSEPGSPSVLRPTAFARVRRLLYDASAMDDGVDLVARLGRIKQLTDKYLTVQHQSSAAQQLADTIRREVDAARAQLRVITTHTKT